MTTDQNISNKEFEELLSKYDYKFQKGDLVKGIVVGYDGEGVIVDIGAKSTALVYSKEARADMNVSLEETLEKGKEYEFLIVKEEDENGRFGLSYKKVAMAYSWKQLQDVKANDEVVEGDVVQIVRGGILVDVKGVRGFVPLSHLKKKDTELSVGDKLELKILTMDLQQNNFILSNRKVYNDQQLNNKKDIFESIEIGSIREGEIVRITDFGAFIDIGGLDGLLPLSQISWRWVEHPKDILKLGETIKVEVIGIDNEKQRVSLSLKNLEQDPWQNAKETISEGAKVEGCITRIKHFGAFVEVFPGVEALLPQNELLDYQKEKNVVLNVGDKIFTTILKFNPADRRISLSLKEDFVLSEDTKEEEV